MILFILLFLLTVGLLATAHKRTNWGEIRSALQMAIVPYTTPSGFVGWNSSCGGLGDGKIAYLIVVKGGLQKLNDYSDVAEWDALIASGDVVAVIPCRGNFAAGSTGFKQASGTKSEQKTGTQFQIPIIIDRNWNNMTLINQLNDDCNDYGVIFVMKDFNAAHILDNKATQRYLPVTFDLTTQSEASEQSTLETTGTVRWISKKTEFYEEVPSVIVQRPTRVGAVTSSAIVATGFDLSWAAISGATSYELDVSTDLNFGSFVTGYNAATVAVGTDPVTTSVTGLTASTTYYVRVRAKNGVGTGASSAVIAVTTTA